MDGTYNMFIQELIINKWFASSKLEKTSKNGHVVRAAYITTGDSIVVDISWRRIYTDNDRKNRFWYSVVVPRPLLKKTKNKRCNGVMTSHDRMQASLIYSLRYHIGKVDQGNEYVSSAIKRAHTQAHACARINVVSRRTLYVCMHACMVRAFMCNNNYSNELLYRV